MKNQCAIVYLETNKRCHKKGVAKIKGRYRNKIPFWVCGEHKFEYLNMDLDDADPKSYKLVPINKKR